MVTSASTAYAKSGDVHIAYQVSGDGPPDLVFVPDGSIPIESMGEERSLARFLDRLSSFSRVIRFDRRGMGLSDPVTRESPPTLEQWMGDLEAVLDAAGSEQTVLLGMAEGGFVVTLLAATRPARIRSLVLVNATPGFTAGPFREWGLAAGAIDRLGESVSGDWGEVDWGIPLFAPSAVGDGEYSAWLKRSMRRSLSPAMAAAVFDVLYRSDIRDVLPTVRVPTLVIHRRHNRYLEPAHGRYIAEQIPGALFLEVEGQDHVPYLGDPRPILDAIEEFVLGARRPPEIERVLATVLFTDIVASSERAVALGDKGWRDLLISHHATLRADLGRYGGRELDMAGDGIFATFDGPARAVRCASSMIAAAGQLGIEIRAGLHTGECEIIGDKLGGIAVHIGARIAALARPGEVLVSSTVKDLVAGSGLQFESRGLHELKGIPAEWQLYAVDQSSP